MRVARLLLLRGQFFFSFPALGTVVPFFPTSRVSSKDKSSEIRQPKAPVDLLSADSAAHHCTHGCFVSPVKSSLRWFSPGGSC